MPRFDNEELQVNTAGHFGFSAVRVEDLGATEYTLVTIVADRSGSTDGFTKDMESALKEVVKSCQHSPRADNLLIRLIVFEDTHEEIHGFKLLEQCNTDDYDGVLRPGGCTALYDASLDAVEATTNYAKQLTDQDFGVNAILFVITDGMDNKSKFLGKHVGDALKKAVVSESMESIVSVLIAVNESGGGSSLKDFHAKAGFSQFVELKDASKSTLARLANFVSKSISSQSQSLGTGGQSASITF